jgi:hypothetical protein
LDYSWVQSIGLGDQKFSLNEALLEVKGSIFDQFYVPNGGKRRGLKPQRTAMNDLHGVKEDDLRPSY